MPYRFGETQLRVVHDFLAQKKDLLSTARFLVLEHLLPTTLEFVRLLKLFGANVFGIIAKPYSIDEGVFTELTSMGLDVIRKADYAEIESGDVAGDLLRRAQQASSKDGRKIVIIDVGGYFAAPLVALGDGVDHVAGIVEDTTFGHNRYANVADSIRVPILSVARSELKEIEARFVGRDAVAAMDIMLREIGVSISGRNALVIGYGMIGKNVARTLRRYDLKVHVYDKKDTMNLRAYADGFAVHRRVELLKRADIIFSATGSEAIYGVPALSYTEIEDHCRDDVVLASVGSRKSEFAMDDLKRRTASKKQMSRDFMRYVLTKGTGVIVARDGSAVNFSLQSIPIEILDLVFSEITTCFIRLLEGDGLAVGTVNMLSGAPLELVAKDWLRRSNDL